MSRPRPLKPPAGFVKAQSATPFFTLLGRFYEQPQEGPCPVFGIRIRPKHLNRYGTAHGGFIATLADASMAAFLRLRLPDLVAMRTITLQVDYKRPCPLGAWVTIHDCGLEQHSTERGERGVITVEIHVDGQLASRAIGKFKLIFEAENP